MAQAGGSGGGAGRAGRRGAAVVSPPAPAGGAVEPGTRPNKLLRLTAVAERLGCSKKTAWRLYQAGAFPGAGVMLGAVKVPEQVLLAYIRRHRPVSQ